MNLCFLHFCVLLLFVIGCQPAKTRNSLIEKTNGSENSIINTNTLIEGINNLTIEEFSSYHRFLWKSYHVTQKLLLGKEWLEMEHYLQRQGLIGVKALYTNHYYYVLKKDVQFKDVKYPCDVYIEFDIDQHGKISYAEIGLMSDVNITYDLVIKQQTYPIGTAIFLALESDKVKEVSDRFTVLKKVKIAYRFVQGREEYDPYVFFVSLDFVETSHHKETGEISLSFTIESGLDSPEFLEDGKLLQEFIPRDTLGKMRFVGSTETLGKGR